MAGGDSQRTLHFQLRDRKTRKLTSKGVQHNDTAIALFQWWHCVGSRLDIGVKVYIHHLLEFLHVPEWPRPLTHTDFGVVQNEDVQPTKFLHCKLKDVCLQSRSDSSGFTTRHAENIVGCFAPRQNDQNLLMDIEQLSKTRCQEVFNRGPKNQKHILSWENQDWDLRLKWFTMRATEVEQNFSWGIRNPNEHLQSSMARANSQTGRDCHCNSHHPVRKKLLRFHYLWLVSLSGQRLDRPLMCVLRMSLLGRHSGVEPLGDPWEMLHLLRSVSVVIPSGTCPEECSWISGFLHQSPCTSSQPESHCQKSFLFSLFWKYFCSTGDIFFGSKDGRIWRPSSQKAIYRAFLSANPSFILTSFNLCSLLAVTTTLAPNRA